MRSTFGLLFSLMLSLSPPAAAQDAPSIEDLLNATDDIARGTSSVATLTMEVKTERYSRTMKMQAWSQGTEHSLVRILEPAKEAGISTLMVEDNIWNYLPKVDRTMKIPATMMSGNWMGSHITNDDLVRANRLAEEFEANLTAEPTNGEGSYVVELVPLPDAPVVWGKLVLTIRPDLIPTEIGYFDEDGSLVRTMRYEDIQQVGDRMMPMTMRVLPADEPESYTVITYNEIEFDTEIPESTFTLQSLRR